MGFDIVKGSEQIGCKDKSITKTKGRSLEYVIEHYSGFVLLIRP